MIRASILLASLALIAGCNGQTGKSESDPSGAPLERFAPLASIRSASIELPPDEETFGTNPQGEVLDHACLACHSAAMVRYQPKLTRKQWTATADKMREVYKAPFEPSETETIVDALMTLAPSRP